jgi:hypothetical protein
VDISGNYFGRKYFCYDISTLRLIITLPVLSIKVWVAIYMWHVYGPFISLNSAW